MEPRQQTSMKGSMDADQIKATGVFIVIHEIRYQNVLHVVKYIYKTKDPISRLIEIQFKNHKMIRAHNHVNNIT